MPTSSDSKSKARPQVVVGRIVSLAGVASLALVVLGCGQAQVSEGHRELVLRLATGTSTHDLGIIDRAAAEVDQLKADHALTDAETTAFQAILEAARADDWDRAQQLAYALRDGQHPTVEDQERLAKRPLPPMKKLGTRKSQGH